MVESCLSSIVLIINLTGLEISFYNQAGWMNSCKNDCMWAFQIVMKLVWMHFVIFSS